jgi:predicted exporter
MSTAPAVPIGDILTYLSLGLKGAETLLALLKLKSDTPQDVLEAVEAAVAALQKVQGNPVILGQLEAMRLKPQW